MAAADPATIMDLLERGRDDEARALLAPHAAPPPGAPAADRFLAALATLLGPALRAEPAGTAGAAQATRMQAAPRRNEGPPTRLDDATLHAAATALTHAASASTALRAGRVDELLVEAARAGDHAPADLPWLTFLVGSLHQACYRFTGDAALRRRALAVCGRVADRVDRPHLAVAARGLAGNIHMMQGALHRAAELCEAALDLAAATDVADQPAAAMAWQFRGYVLYEWNRLDDAEASLTRAWALAGHRQGVGSGVARMMARVRSAAGDPSGAAAWLDRLEAIVAEPMTLRNREWLTAVRVGRTLGTGSLRAVEEWLASYDYRPGTVAAMDDRAVLARLHELDQVLALLEATEQWGPILDIAPRVADLTRRERRWFAARALSAAAVAREATARPREADALMADALDLGQAGSFVRVYVEGGPLRGALLERARSGPAGQAAIRVLEAAPEAAGSPGRPELTPAQTAVLRRVAAGDANKAIARELGVSVSTVKTHLRAVFERLDVSSRTQAVARGRAVGIL